MLPFGSYLDRIRSSSRLPLVLMWLGAFGLLLRIVICLFSQGSNDIRTWYFFALTVEGFGFADSYVRQPLLNHPPLMTLMSLLALKVSRITDIPFPIIFKAPSLVAEFATMLVLYRLFIERGQRLLASGAFAAYGLSLSAIMISGYHGNTDAMYFFFAFLAAHLMEKRAPFWSGVALGASLNVKLIPVLLGLPLASRCTRFRDLVYYGLGVSLGAIPFLWVFATFGTEARDAFVRNLFMYRSNLEYWGVELAVRWTVTWTHYWAHGIADAARHFGNWYSMAGGKVLLVGSALIALAQLVLSRKLGPGRRWFDAYELATFGFAMFLLFGSGFGVQYVGCVVAPLIACGILRGVLVSTTTGLFITIIYVTYVIQWWPVFSNHHPLAPSFSVWANLGWFSLAYVTYQIIRDAAARAALEPSDGKSSDGKPSDGKSSDGKSSDGKSSDGEPSDDKPSEHPASTSPEPSSDEPVAL